MTTQSQISIFILSIQIKKLIQAIQLNKVFKRYMLKKIALVLTGTGASLYLNKKQECCGIVGVLSGTRSNVSDVLSQGIQLLKNRGYDSAGIVTFENKNNKVDAKLIKHANTEPDQMNCIQKVVQEVTKQIVKSHVGIAHTRWATCGEKVTKNAHPHYDNSGKIFLVHNGIISNHAKLKLKYLSGIPFNSDTDTEVIVQLLGKFKRAGKSMMESIKEVQNIIGKNEQWGLVIIDKDQPNKIYTSTNKSPILVGLGEKQIFIASEVIAFQKHATEFFQTKDGECHEFAIESIQKLRSQLIFERRLKKINKNVQVLTEPPAPYESFYSYQIRQQSLIEFKPDFDRVKAIPFDNFMTLIACGSSYYAGQCSIYFFKMLKAFQKVNIFDPAELQQSDIVDGQTVVMISQSGQTADLIKIVKKCQNKKNVNTIGIINVEGSTLARKVDFPIYIKVGRQISVAATKSMFHQVLNLIQLATEVAERKHQQQTEVIRQIRDDLSKVSKLTSQTIQKVAEKCKNLAQLIYQRESVYLLAMREALPIARQAALKIKELNYIHAEALGSCEMKHGPIALINSEKKQETVVFIWVLDNQTYASSTNAVDQMYSRNAFVVLITDCRQKIEQNIEQRKKENPDYKENYHFMIEVPKVNHLSFLLTLIPMQILVEEIAKLKKIKPDYPRNLAKTVTV